MSPTTALGFDCWDQKLARRYSTNIFDTSFHGFHGTGSSRSIEEPTAVVDDFFSQYNTELLDLIFVGLGTEVVLFIGLFFHERFLKDFPEQGYSEHETYYFLF